MYKNLKKKVYLANCLLPKYSLVIFTWGNVSEIDDSRTHIVIKPSGVAYDELNDESMVVVDMDGNIIAGDNKPSSDTKTHIEIYKAFPEINSVVHTHSKWATIFSQSMMDVPVLGTTHADYFYGPIPCTRELSEQEIQGDYEKETGKVIIETYREREISPIENPGILVASHGPFAMGKSAEEAVNNAVILERICEMAWHNMILGTKENIPRVLLYKHFLRKHGSGAYYGQDKS